MDDTPTFNKVCEVCGCCFATRQGLSSHARLHLRQFGVPLSECTNGPIELLNKIVKERKGSLLDLRLDPKDSTQVSAVPKARNLSKPKCEKIATPVTTGALSGLRRAVSLLPPSYIKRESKEDGMSCKQTLPKPLWAPRDRDAPLTLASNNDEVHVCQVCGAWYETRKGLSSHARAHLRQLGVVDGNSKISPINLLYQLKNIKPEDQCPVSPQTSPKSFVTSLDSPSTSSLGSPPSKRAKVLKKFMCVLCGEDFENRKGLGSHARSHLRQIGVYDLLGKASAVDAIEELASSGMLADIWPMTTNKTSSPSLASLNSSALSSPAHLPVNRGSKAKKGFRFAADPLLKPKIEPQETSLDFTKPTLDGKPIPLILCEYCGQLFDTRKGLSCHVRAHLRQLGIAWTSKSSPIDLLQQLMGKEVSREDTDPSSGKKASSFCELCGFEFHHRKALASHARAHLRQLGVTEWKVDGSKGSPIEILNEWIRKEPAKVAAITQRYIMGDLYIKKRPSQSAPFTDADPLAGRSTEPLGPLAGPWASRELSGAAELPRVERGHVHKQSAFTDAKGSPSSRSRPPKLQVATGQENSDGSPQQLRPGNIPALLPNPPLTPLVKLVGKVYSLKCRFCDQVFQGPMSVQEDWIAHLQKHILKLGDKGKASSSPVAGEEAGAMSPQSIKDAVGV